MIKSMSKEALISTGSLFAETITDALTSYESMIIKASEYRQMKAFMKQLFMLNSGHTYADFYYAALTKQQRKEFLTGLTDGQNQILGQFELNQEQVFYRVEEAEYEFLLDITMKEHLFSTFYFTNRKATVWGNYQLEFPLFCEEKEILLSYKKLAEEYGLESYQ